MAWSIARCVACALSISDWISGAYCGWPRRERGCEPPVRFFDGAVDLDRPSRRRRRRARARSRRAGSPAKALSSEHGGGGDVGDRSSGGLLGDLFALDLAQLVRHEPQVTRPKPGLTPVWARGVSTVNGGGGVAVREDHVGVVLQRLQVAACRTRCSGRARASSPRASASAASVASVSASARAPSSPAISSESRVSQLKRTSATAACSSSLALIRPSSRSTWIRCAPSRRRCNSSRAARARCDVGGRRHTTIVVVYTTSRRTSGACGARAADRTGPAAGPPGADAGRAAAAGGPRRTWIEAVAVPSGAHLHRREVDELGREVQPRQQLVVAALGAQQREVGEVARAGAAERVVAGAHAVGEVGRRRRAVRQADQLAGEDVVGELARRAGPAPGREPGQVVAVVGARRSAGGCPAPSRSRGRRPCRGRPRGRAAAGRAGPAGR